MKARIFTFLMICFIANFFTAQTLVKPADFNIKDIASYLKTQNFVIDETIQVLHLSVYGQF